jgi:tripartite-type tricarboxylate transporter receptor subunit TctC
MPDIPLMQELITVRKQAEVAEFLSSGAPIGRALLLSRMVPPDRVAALRRAFMAMTADPKFVHDTAQAGLELDPMPGEELDSISASILQTPQDVVTLARAVGK